MRISLSAVVLCFIATTITASTFAEDNTASLVNQINWIVGPAQVPLGNVAKLNLPAKYRFADAQGARILAEATHNPTDGSELGVVVPPADDPKCDWYMALNYHDVGFVKDDEKDALDDTTVGNTLDAIRQATNEANQERLRRGWSPMTVIGWQQRPFYDQYTHLLTWAIVGSDGTTQSVNYSGRILGRGGFISANLVLAPEELAATVPAYQKIVTDVSFKVGQSYADFIPGDKISEYGLVGLIAGTAAVAVSKGWPLLFLKKIVLVSIAIVGAAIAKVKSLFNRKKRAGTVATGQ